MKIPLSKPYLGLSEKLNVIKALNSGWLTQNGLEVKKLENNLKNFYIDNKSQHLDVTTTSNGTTALHLALISIGVGLGDEVIIPNFCYVAVANSVLYCGATPVIVEVESDSWNLNPIEVRKAITENTKAVIAVDNYGTPCNYDELHAVIPPHVKIIQDASEYFPGGFIENSEFIKGELVTCSFYANKILTAGEGGAIFSTIENVSKIKHLKNQAQEPNTNFAHDTVGYNYRLSNLHAAVFNAQWKKRKKIIQKRKRIFDIYIKLLDEFNISYTSNQNTDTAFWLFAIKLQYHEIDIVRIREILKKEGIETRPGFTPLSRMNYIKSKSHIRGLNLISDDLYSKIICLPTYPDLRSKQLRYIVKNLKLAIETLKYETGN